MRPVGALSKGQWAGTVAHVGRGVCSGCYKRAVKGKNLSRPFREQRLTDSPVPCEGCGRMMRPINRKAEGQWAGTVVHAGHGLCGACYRRRRAR